MLTGTGLSDESGLAHSFRQKCLPEHIVDLVRAGVIQVFSLQQKAKPELLTKAVTL